MRKTIGLLAAGVVVMAAAIGYALLAGDLRGEARVLFDYPWFHVSMIDLYTGFLLFSGWIVFREQSRGVAAIWIVLLLTLGNFAACAYALAAAIRARGDWNVFWLGTRATVIPEARSEKMRHR
jgi:hypothetical protein